MHELIKRLYQVEVVTNDFVIVGFGDTQEEATCDYDHNLEVFLLHCEEKGMKLNPEKVRLREQQVPFIGHVTTGQGLCVDPGKVQTILEVPPPKDVAAVQHLLGLTLYLSKFLPHLSDITKPFQEISKRMWIGSGTRPSRVHWTL